MAESKLGGAHTRANPSTYEIPKHHERSHAQYDEHSHTPRPLGHDIAPAALQGRLLHHAFVGTASEVHHLILVGTDVNCKDKDEGNTPLHNASRTGHLHIAEALLKAGAKLDEKNNIGETPLHQATDANHFYMAELLVDAGAGLDIQDGMGWTALHNASGCGDHGEIVDLLLAKGAALNIKNKDGQTAHDLAIEEGHPEAASHLVAHPEHEGK